MKFEKRLYCRYDSSVNFENSTGGLRIFIPTSQGYVNYNLVHSIVPERGCDTWRLSIAYAFDDNFENGYPLTPPGAEWDMALRILGRPDFIGGFAHGDEVYTSISAQIDGEEVEIDSLGVLTPSKEITISVESVGYDPDDSKTPAIKHFKKFIITEQGVVLKQRVQWLNDYTVASSYMAMMPPLKTLTDSFYTDVDKTPKEVSFRGYVIGAREAVVYGRDSGVAFSMSVSEYPDFVGGKKFSITDNGRGLYNKMYFTICDGESVSRGDVWETETRYVITNGKKQF